MIKIFLGTLAALIVFSLLAGGAYIVFIERPAAQAKVLQMQTNVDLLGTETLLEKAARAVTRKEDLSALQSEFQTEWEPKLTALQTKPRLTAEETDLVTKLERIQRLLFPPS